MKDRKNGHNGRAPARTEEPIRVFVIHPHRTTQWALERLIETDAALVIAGIANDAKTAFPLLEKSKAQVILFWVLRGEYDALESVPQLAGSANAKVIVLCDFRDPTLQDKAVLAGARGIAELEASPELILTAIKRVHDGELWIDRQSANRILVEFMRQRASRRTDPELKKITSLTTRERQIVEAATAHPGATARVLAVMLNISEHTARNHLNAVYEKLQVSNRVELFDYANRHGLAPGRNTPETVGR